jgi:predicted DNA binding CopG/RHH family protein
MNDKPEKELYSSIEHGEWQEVKDFSRLKLALEKAASDTSTKDYRMNVRISRRDVEALKTKALEEGIPYQTLVTSILHKYITGNLVENSR